MRFLSEKAAGSSAGRRRGVLPTSRDLGFTAALWFAAATARWVSFAVGDRSAMTVTFLVTTGALLFGSVWIYGRSNSQASRRNLGARSSRLG